MNRFYQSPTMSAALALCVDTLTPPRNDEEAHAVRVAKEAHKANARSEATFETVACLWEAVLDMEARTDSETIRYQPEDLERAAQIRATREEMGSSHLRLTVIGWADAADAAWKLADDPKGTGGGEYGDSFDWEFIPGWIIDNVDWSDPHGPTLRPAPVEPPVAPAEPAPFVPSLAFLSSYSKRLATIRDEISGLALLHEANDADGWTFPGMADCFGRDLIELHAEFCAAVDALDAMAVALPVTPPPLRSYDVPVTILATVTVIAANKSEAAVCAQMYVEESAPTIEHAAGWNSKQQAGEPIVGDISGYSPEAIAADEIEETPDDDCGTSADHGAALDALAPALRTYLVDAESFAPELQGGGCVSLVWHSPAGGHVMITDADGSDMPSDDSWMVGLYPAEWDGEEITYFTSNGPGVGTIEQAVSGAKAWVLAWASALEMAK